MGMGLMRGDEGNLSHAEAGGGGRKKLRVLCALWVVVGWVERRGN